MKKERTLRNIIASAILAIIVITLMISPLIKPKEKNIDKIDQIDLNLIPDPISIITPEDFL